MEENGTYRWAPPKEKKEPNWKKVKHTVLSVIVILVLLLLVSTCYYTVDDKQQAVVTTFGRVTDITDAGVHSGKFRIALPGHEYMAVRLTRV